MKAHVWALTAILAVAGCEQNTPEEPNAAAVERQTSVGGAATADGAGDPEDFEMTILDVFTISGRRTVVTGSIEAGRVDNGAEVCLFTSSGSRRVEVAGLERFRDLIETASAGDNVGIVLNGVDEDEVQRGGEDRLTAAGRC